MYLIHGFFCQESQGLAIGFVAGEGAVPFVREDFIQVMFAGKILIGNLNGAEHFSSGEIQDRFGWAQLSDISFSPEGEFRFVKTYVGSAGNSLISEPGISYVLHREKNGTWVGEYTVPGPDEFKGPVRCVITKVDEKLFADDLKRFAAENARCERESSP